MKKQISPCSRTDGFSISFMVHPHTHAKNRGVLSRVRSGLRKRLLSSSQDDKTGAIKSPRCRRETSTPNIRGSFERSCEDEDMFECSENNTNTCGIFSLLDDDEKHTWKQKMQKQKRDHASSKSEIEVPPLVSDVASLLSIFPSCDKATMAALLYQFKGNCFNIYEHLSKDHKPDIDHNPEIFKNTTDEHYTTPYFHGEAIDGDMITEMFMEEQSGSYITVYRTKNESIQYLLCFKNILDGISEKPIRGPVVPGALVSMLDLTKPIPADNSPDNVNVLPCLYSTLYE